MKPCRAASSLGDLFEHIVLRLCAALAVKLVKLVGYAIDRCPLPLSVKYAPRMDASLDAT
jgi:hypothetical protein